MSRISKPPWNCSTTRTDPLSGRSNHRPATRSPNRSTPRCAAPPTGSPAPRSATSCTATPRPADSIRDSPPSPPPAKPTANESSPPADPPNSGPPAHPDRQPHAPEPPPHRAFGRFVVRSPPALHLGDELHTRLAPGLRSTRESSRLEVPERSTLSCRRLIA